MTQYYKRITGSVIQGTASTVTEPVGTIVVTNDGELRLHDGTTAGGISFSGGAPASSLVNGDSIVSIAIANEAITITRGATTFGPSQPAPAVTWTFGGGPVKTALTIPGYVQGSVDTGIVNSVLMGMALNGTNYMSLGMQDGNANEVRLKFGSSSKNGINGDVEIQTINSNTPTSIILSPQGGQNGSFVFGGDGTLNLPLATNGKGVIQTTGDYYFSANGAIYNLGADGVLTVPGDIKSTAGTGPVVINSNDGATTHTWTFGGNGSLALPNNNKITAPVSNPVVVKTSSIATTTYSGSYMGWGSAGIPGTGEIEIPYFAGSENVASGWTITLHPDNIAGTVFNVLRLQNSMQIYWNGATATQSGTYTLTGPALIDQTWTFGSDSSLTFPQGGTLRVGTVPAHSTGATGDKAGTVAFANGYIYYCTADHAPTQYLAETRIGDANGVDSGYLIPNSYQLPSVGWIIYHNNQTAVINQVNNGGNPGWYTVFTASPLFIPANTAIQYGPPSADIWKRVAWSGDTW
jgi:hypothetical protein